MNSSQWDRIASCYYDEILSPIKNSTLNPLQKDLDRIHSKHTKVVADLGCGLGEMLPYLSTHFRNVHAVDFSREMLKHAAKKVKAKNITFHNTNLTNLESLKDQIDVALAINSVITHNLSDIHVIFSEIYKTLKEDGTFICIVPSMEQVIYQAVLISENAPMKRVDKIKERIRRIIKPREHDLLLGIYDYDGKQKAYYRFELIWRLRKAGFKHIVIKKVNYSWEPFKEGGQSYFPNEEPPWDWYAICRK